MAQNIENTSHADCWRCSTHGPEGGFAKRSPHELHLWREVKILRYDEIESTITVKFIEESKKYKRLRKELKDYNGKCILFLRLLIFKTNLYNLHL